MKITNPKFTAKILMALGVDPLNGEYFFNGEELTIKGISEADIKSADESLDIITLEKEESNAKDKEKQREKDEVDAKSTPTTLAEVIADVERMKRIMGIK